MVSRYHDSVAIKVKSRGAICSPKVLGATASRTLVVMRCMVVLIEPCRTRNYKPRDCELFFSLDTAQALTAQLNRSDLRRILIEMVFCCSY